MLSTASYLCAQDRSSQAASLFRIMTASLLFFFDRFCRFHNSHEKISWLVPAQKRQKQNDENLRRPLFTEPGIHYERNIILLLLRVPGYFDHVTPYDLSAHCEISSYWPSWNSFQRPPKAGNVKPGEVMRMLSVSYGHRLFRYFRLALCCSAGAR